MVVQHNIASMNTNRQLGIATNTLSKSTEKLSSGYKINRAADDAAGLAISEKLRAQIRGLNRASDNAQDGISLIQTAEGAMDQQHAILQRTRELLVQASNTGTLDGSQENDFQKIQDEINTLKEEYQRIGTDTEYNKKKLLNGSYQSQTLQLGANKGQSIKVSIDLVKWNLVTFSSNDSLKSYKAGALDKATNTKSEKLYKDFASKSLNFGVSKSYNIVKSTGAGSVGGFDKSTGITTTVKSTVQSGSGEAFSQLIDVVDNMIKEVSTQRSKLGAIQNRLEYTIKVDDNTAENLQSAESQLRDTDMAEEMTKYSAASIIQQAGTSMLAQANQQNQSVLSLLG
jgi:flagellin